MITYTENVSCVLYKELSWYSTAMNVFTLNHNNHNWSEINIIRYFYHIRVTFIDHYASQDALSATSISIKNLEGLGLWEQ